MTIRTQIPDNAHSKSEPLAVSDEQKQGFEFIGCRLAVAREKRGLSIQDATETTGITVQNLKLLEAGKLQLSLAPAYVKGYIQCYAKAVSVPPEELMLAYQEGIEQTRRGNNLGTDGQSKNNRLIFRVTAAAVVSVLMLLAVMVLLVMPVQSNMLLKTDNAPKAASSTDPGGEVLTADSLLIAPVVDSWLEITDSEGNILKADLIPARQPLKVQGSPPFHLLVGHGGEVVVNYLEQSIHLTADSGDNSARIVLGD